MTRVLEVAGLWMLQRPSGPMQRQVPIWASTWMHPPAFGEINQTYEKMVPNARAMRHDRPGSGAASERLEHHQEHDEDHQDRRYLIDDTIEFLRMPVAVVAEIIDPADKKSVHGRHRQHQDDLGGEPMRHVPVAVPGEPEPQRPGGDHGRSDDRL